MRKFNNPLDNIRVASPCSANWESMFGNDRKRHCGDCKMNVYNLSDVTRQEAENLLINSEGRLCVRYFRRPDGTVLTKNCPLGWQAAKQRASRVVTAAFSMIAGLFTGIFAFNLLKEEPYGATMGTMAVPTTQVMGDIAPYSEIRGEISPLDFEKGEYVNGQMTMGKPAIIVSPNQVVKVNPRRK